MIKVNRSHERGFARKVLRPRRCLAQRRNALPRFLKAFFAPSRLCARNIFLAEAPKCIFEALLVQSLHERIQSRDLVALEIVLGMEIGIPLASIRRRCITSRYVYEHSALRQLILRSKLFVNGTDDELVLARR